MGEPLSILTVSFAFVLEKTSYMDSIRSTIRSFISDTFFVDDFEDGASFLKSGTIDSTGMMELVNFVEQSFGFKVEDNELVPENLDSLDNLVQFISRKKS
ncbi:MAG: acyl carrier protein [Cystobacterineae bacterium]|nr:acyl carrier protein [Cystobacterineae bacterium]